MKTLPKISSGKKKRNSTKDFPTMSKNMDRSEESKKSSKRKTIQSITESAIILNGDSPKKSEKLSLHLLSREYDYYEPPIFSNKQIGPLKSFSYNSYQGLFKDYNEDKISISSLIKKPSSSKIKSWPKISYFSIFDGHGGEECSEFLKDNYLKYIAHDERNFLNKLF